MRFQRKKLFSAPKKGPLPFYQAFILALVLFLALTILSLYIVSDIIKPTIMNIANLETEKVATSAINYSVSRVLNNVNMDELIVTNEDKEGNIQSVSFNPTIYNQVQVEAVANAQTYLLALESGNADLFDNTSIIVGIDGFEDGIIHNIPLGAATKNAFFAQLGPKIPVKFTTKGDVDVDFNEEVKNVGINNTWIRISLDLKVRVEVMLPFASDINLVLTTIPIGMTLVPGEVPYFYGGSGQGGGPTPAFLVEE